MRHLKTITAAALTAIAVTNAPSAQAERVEVCPSGRSAVATVDTSCAFADNLAANYYRQPGSTIIAYSPVTGLYYTMQCFEGYHLTDGWTGEVKRCSGINAYGALLVVYID